MKKTFCGALLLLPCLAQAQTENFAVKGTVTNNAAVSKAYLGYPVDKKWSVDSAVVKNGRFEFKGTLPEPVRASLTFSHNGTALRKSRDASRKFFYLEKGTITVTTRDSATKIIVRGTPLNDENAKLEATLKPLSEQYEALTKKHEARSEATPKDPGHKTQHEATLASIETAQQKVRADYVKTHPDARFSLLVLQDLEGPTPEIGAYAALYQGLSASVRSTLRGQRIGEQIKRLQKVAVGAIAPDFTQNTPDNLPVKLSSLRGQYVLIDFWASWCGPCRQENPNLVKAFNTYKDKVFTILSVSLDQENGREAWVKAIQKDNLTWTHVSDLKFWNNAVAQEYGVQAVPQSFLLDPSGKIVAINLRGEELQSTLDKLLKTK